MQIEGLAVEERVVVCWAVRVDWLWEDCVTILSRRGTRDGVLPLAEARG